MLEIQNEDHQEWKKKKRKNNITIVDRGIHEYDNTLGEIFQESGKDRKDSYENKTEKRTSELNEDTGTCIAGRFQIN